MNLESALADLASKIGTELRVSPWTTITQERIDRFADATGDHQWIHIDPERARAESPFGATIAHGYWCSRSIRACAATTAGTRRRCPA